MAHTRYISNIAVAAPRVKIDLQRDLIKAEAFPGSSLKFVPLPSWNSVASCIIKFPLAALSIVRAVRDSDIVHSGVAGWPIPLGLIANPAAHIFGKKIVIVIESTHWRAVNSLRPSLKKRAVANLVEALARWSIRHANLSIFTSHAYKDSLFCGSGLSMVNPASWIEEKVILQDADIKLKSGHLRLLFAGSLNASKGVRLVLEAARELERRGTEIVIDIIGDGPLNSECKQVAEMLKKIRIRVLKPIPYGPKFFSIISGYHAVLVPTLSEEQPRIIFDAFSQGVPVIASDTGGNREVVHDGQDGYLFPSGDAEALAYAIQHIDKSREQLVGLGQQAARKARAYTHEAMHMERAKIYSILFREV